MSVDKLKKERRRKIRKVKAELKRLGLSHVNMGIVNSIEELKQQPPGMVLARVVRSAKLSISNRPFTLVPGDIYCMPFNLYKNINDLVKDGNTPYIEPANEKFIDVFKRYNGEALDNKKLFMWRTGGLGDLLFTQPIVKYLKEKYPTCTITYGTDINNFDFMNSWPKGLIDNLVCIPYRGDMLNMHDYHMTFEGSIERCKESHVLNSYDIFKKMANLEFDSNQYPIELVVDQEIKNHLQKLIGENFILTHFKSSSPIRTLGPHKQSDIINELVNKGFKVGMIDNKKFTFYYEEFLRMFKFDNTKVMNLAAYSENMKYAIAMVDLSIGCITIDSSISHVAAALGKPVYGLYGPFKGELRMKYYKTANWMNADSFNDCGKYPCFYHEGQFHNCPYMVMKPRSKPAGCMESLDNNKIVKEFFNLIRQHNPLMRV